MTPGLNGDKAIVVLDPDELDTTALRLATMWARWVLRRKLADDERELDVDAVAELVDEASRALSQHATIKGCHTVARKKIDEAGAMSTTSSARSRTCSNGSVAEIDGD